MTEPIAVPFGGEDLREAKKQELGGDPIPSQGKGYFRGPHVSITVVTCYTSLCNICMHTL